MSFGIGFVMQPPGDNEPIDLIGVFAEMVQSAPPPLRMAMVGTLILRLCDVAVCESVPEEERANPEAWEGHAPRDFFEGMLEPLRESLADSERMAEAWNEFSLKKAEEIADSDEQLTIPEKWLSLWTRGES